MHKAGFVNILGKPNAGKSSLMNAILGEKLSIITSKAQTTRHRIMGILNEPDYQIVFSDTPGIVKPSYKLHEKMMHFVEESLTDADIFLFVIDASEKNIEDPDNPLYQKVEEKLQKSDVPVIIAINKMDLIDQKKLEALGQLLHTKFPTAQLIPVSATKKFNTDTILKVILEYLPEGEPYFDKEEISDKPMRFFAAEMIREKILLYYEKEIPYSVEVVVNSYKEEEKITKIQADIFVARESQKNIIIGQGGLAIKNLGTAARKEIENFIGNKVFLEIFVKVKKNWRDDESILKNMGY